MPQAPATPGPFIARTAEDLSQMMLDYFGLLGTGITDMNEGAVVRSELEACAQLGEQFYADLATTLPDAIAQAAYRAFNFSPLPMEKATGYLVFNVTTALAQPLNVASGTLWQPSGQSSTYATTTPFTIPSAQTGRWHVPASALVLGTAGNLASGTAGNLQYPVSGLTVYAEDGAVHTGDVVVPSGATPLKAGFTGGRDPEKPLEMETRFTSFLSSLHRSTLAALRYGATTAAVTNADGTIAEQAVLARAIDHSVDSTLVPSTGVASVYIFNGIGSPGGQLTSSALVAAAQAIIDGSTANGLYDPGYKAAGIPTTVFAVSEYLVSFTASVTALGSGTATAIPAAFLKAEVIQAVQQFFTGYQIGQTFYLSALQSAIGALRDVQAVTVTALSIVRQADATVMTSTVGDWSTPSNGILLLASGQPTINVQ